MQNMTAVEKRREISTVNELAKKPNMVKRFADVLGSTDKANQFLASLISATNGSSLLSKCDPTKVIGCAMVAASLNLDINPNLGLASIVPYKNGNEIVPQFQMGWKGFVQLAMRSGQYRTMNVTEVYEDEFDAFDPFKGELKYHIVNGGDRDNSREDKIVGYAFYFELTTGYSKMTYMSKEKIEAHALRYSKAYQYDVKNGKTTSPWSTQKKEMAMKTVVKLVLSKFGILSTQMQTARFADESAVSADGESFEYIDNGSQNVYEDTTAVVEDVSKEEPRRAEKKADKEVVETVPAVEDEAQSEDLVF